MGFHLGTEGRLEFQQVIGNVEQKKGYLGLREQQEPRREHGEGERCLGAVGGRRVRAVQAAGLECLDGRALCTVFRGRCCHHFCLTGEETGLRKLKHLPNITQLVRAHGEREKRLGKQTGNSLRCHSKEFNFISQAKVLTIPGQGSGSFGKGTMKLCIMIHCRQ